MPSLNFDGDYGHTYRSSIRHTVPGHDTLHEIARAAMVTTSSQALRALVVGPGPGDELPFLLEACPQAQLTVLEPSAQMLAFCRETLSGHAGRPRCQFLQSSLVEACNGSLKDAVFDLVICHNVLHLFNSDQQNQMLRQLAARTDHAGTLLLSAYSEPKEPSLTDNFLAVGRERLLNRGLPTDKVEAVMASRNQVVFSVDDTRVSAELAAAGMAAPIQLYQALFAKLWLIPKP